MTSNQKDFIMVKRIFTTFLFILAAPLASLAAVYDYPPAGSDIVGETFVIEAHRGDNFAKLAAQYNISLHELGEANPGVNPKHIRAGQHIVIPTEYVLPVFRQGIVINLAELRLYYFDNDSKRVYTYPVGLGRREWRTPTASAKVTRKQEDPTWYVPESIADFVFEQTGRILPDYIPPGPENPLGHHAIYMSLSGYLIHGTNQPWSVGQLISSGCIRLYSDDVAELYSLVKIGDPVHIIHHPYKVGWHYKSLVLEAHVPMSIDDPINKLNVLSIDRAIRQATKDSDANVDWNNIDRIVRHPTGIPLVVGKRASRT